ncbi:MAG: hypothetical protein M1438_03650 [Deltaproteobacteria bacterium]|nr:hypothetical protein [Deltaproteobacteria bacterium]
MVENITDPFTTVIEEQEVLVSAVLAHPLHGRLVERLIFYVRPDLDFLGQHFELTWWGGGAAYYKAVASS